MDDRSNMTSASQTTLSRSRLCCETTSLILHAKSTPRSQPQPHIAAVTSNKVLAQPNQDLANRALRKHATVPVARPHFALDLVPERLIVGFLAG